MKLSKRKLVKLLDKEGIDASASQSKSELVRLLLLAHKANAPTRVGFGGRRISKRSLLIVLVLGFLLVTVLILWKVNPVFQENVSFLVNKITGVTNDEETDSSGPGTVIYEKGGKTYVVYDHPLVQVDVVTDKDCKRPACDLQSYYDQINESITNLTKFNEHDFTSRQGKSLIKNFDVNLLPVLIFDSTIEKTENWENTSRFFTKKKDRYLLQLSPYRALDGPDLSNGQLFGQNVDSEPKLSVVEYTSFSCPHCVDMYENVNELLNIYEGDITLVIKYFSRGAIDTQAAIAAECAGQQDLFLDMHNKLFENQQQWLPLAESRLPNTFASYATQVGANRAEFLECYYNDESVKELIDTHTKEAESLGVDGLPAFFINNNIVEGTFPLESFTDIIDDILAEDGFEIETEVEEVEE